MEFPDAVRSAGPTHTEQDAYDRLQCYTLAHGDPAFLHQHIVDAWAAQHADDRTKPIGLTFALVGLYLHLEKGYRWCASVWEAFRESQQSVAQLLERHGTRTGLK